MTKVLKIFLSLLLLMAYIVSIFITLIQQTLQINNTCITEDSIFLFKKAIFTLHNIIIK